MNVASGLTHRLEQHIVTAKLRGRGQEKHWRLCLVTNQLWRECGRGRVYGGTCSWVIGGNQRGQAPSPRFPGVSTPSSARTQGGSSSPASARQAPAGLL